MGFDIKNNPPKKFKPHARMRHVVIIVIITILTWCDSIMSHAILIITKYLLNITCTLVAIGMILGRLECTLSGCHKIVAMKVVPRKFLLVFMRVHYCRLHGCLDGMQYGIICISLYDMQFCTV